MRFPNPRACRALLPAALLLFAVLPSDAAPGMKPLDFAGLKRVIAAKKGRVVVVNYWATWCGPCMEKLPSLAKLSARYKKQGVDLVNVSFDREANAGVAAAALAKHGLASPDSYLQKGSLEAFVVGMEPKYPADEAVNLPRTYVFSRGGKLVKVFDDAQAMPAVERLVRTEAAKRR